MVAELRFHPRLAMAMAVPWDSRHPEIDDDPLNAIETETTLGMDDGATAVIGKANASK